VIEVEQRNVIDFSAREDLDRVLDAVKQGLPEWIASSRDKGIVFGFDGFLDQIYTVVSKRLSVHDYEPVVSMAEWADILKNSAGSAANFEIIEKKRSTGGFVANTAGSLVSLLGSPLQNVTIAGNFGTPDILPIFSDFFAGSYNCKMISIGEPGYTHAYEFDDGKLMMTSFASILTLDANAILASIPEQQLIELLDASDLFGLGYWSITTGMTSIFRYFATTIFPALHKPLHLFLDLASLRKRSDDDIGEAASIIASFPENARVTLSLNDKEAIQLYEALMGQKITDIYPESEISIDNKDVFLFVIGAIHQQLTNCQVIIHSPKYAFAIDRGIGDDGINETICVVPNAFTEKASFLVAAGDAFNGGACLGVLAGCKAEEVLLIGNAVASYFIRTGQRCNQDQTMGFLNQYPQYLEEDHSEIIDD